MKNLTLLLLLTALLATSAMADYINLYDGGSHIIGDNRYEDDHLELDNDNPNDPGTSLTLLTGGIIGGGLATFNTSVGNVAGGSIGEDIWAYDNSIVNISDGMVNGHVRTWDTSIIEISGGSIGGKLSAKEEGTIKVTGGVISGIFDVWHDGIIELYGSGFSVGGENLSVGNSLRDYGTLELVDGDYFYTGTITGILNDGSTLNNYFQILEPTAADIVIVPEPATLTLFITGLGAMVIRKRKHN